MVKQVMTRELVRFVPTLANAVYVVIVDMISEIVLMLKALR